MMFFLPFLPGSTANSFRNVSNGDNITNLDCNVTVRITAFDLGNPLGLDPAAPPDFHLGV